MRANGRGPLGSDAMVNEPGAIGAWPKRIWLNEDSYLS